MRRHIVFILAALFSLYSVHAQADYAATQPTASVAQKTPAPKRGMLYRVDYRGNTSYLFGTVHVGQTSFYPLEPQVTRALSEAGKLVIEVDIRDTAALQQAIVRHGIYPDGQTIAQHLSADSMEKLQLALQRAGIPLASIARMKPWMAVNMLIMDEMARNGFPIEQGIELYFLALAKTQNKTVQGLETADHQLALFDSMKGEQQEEYLKENLAELADGQAMKKGLRLITAWQGADSKALEAALLEIQSDPSTSARFMQRVMLDQRNPNMAKQIETLLKNDKTSFVAVGALHLLGNKGVPALLQQRGYQVQKLY